MVGLSKSAHGVVFSPVQVCGWEEAFGCVIGSGVAISGPGVGVVEFVGWDRVCRWRWGAIEEGLSGGS